MQLTNSSKTDTKACNANTAVKIATPTLLSSDATHIMRHKINFNI